MNANYHAVWCDHREGAETHDDTMPYCYKQIQGIELNPSKGEKFPPQMWVYTTASAHPCVLTSGERAENDCQYDGIELVTEHHTGDDWVEQKLRLSADAARSLAAILVRAADIKQGLTR